MVLKNSIYYPNFCGLGIWSWLSWVLCFQVSAKAAVKVSQGLWSHLKIWLGKNVLPSSFSGCWQDSVLCRLLDWGPSFLTGYWSSPLSVLCHMSLSKKQPVSSKHVSQEGNRESLLAKRKSHSFKSQSWKWHPITFPVLYLLETICQAEPTCKGRLLHKGIHTRRWGSQ